MAPAGLRRAWLAGLAAALLLGGGLAWFARSPRAAAGAATAAPEPARPEDPTPVWAPTVLAVRPERQPRLAVVLDDWGYQTAPLRRLPGLSGPLTLAVIPRLAHSRLAAETGAALGHEVIVHCPMQARGGGHPEPGLLKSGLNADQVRTSLDEDFSSVPGAVGLNNHEGSLATEDRVLMDRVAAVLKERGVYFLDSVTSPRSAIPAAAQAAGVPWAVRRVFLDNVDEPGAIAVQLAEAADQARRKGHCIVIGHPRPATLDVLEAQLPKLQAQGIQLVRVSALLTRP